MSALWPIPLTQTVYSAPTGRGEVTLALSLSLFRCFCLWPSPYFKSLFFSCCPSFLFLPLYCFPLFPSLLSLSSCLSACAWGWLSPLISPRVCMETLGWGTEVTPACWRWRLNHCTGNLMLLDQLTYIFAWHAYWAWTCLVCLCSSSVICPMGGKKGHKPFFVANSDLCLLCSCMNVVIVLYVTDSMCKLCFKLCPSDGLFCVKYMFLNVLVSVVQGSIWYCFSPSCKCAYCLTWLHQLVCVSVNVSVFVCVLSVLCLPYKCIVFLVYQCCAKCISFTCIFTWASLLCFSVFMSFNQGGQAITDTFFIFHTRPFP